MKRINVNLVAPVTLTAKTNGNTQYAYARARVAYNDPVSGQATFMNTYFSGEDAGVAASLTTKDLFSILVSKERLKSMKKEYINEDTGEIHTYNDIGRSSHIQMVSSGAVRDAKKASLVAMSNPGIVA